MGRWNGVFWKALAVAALSAGGAGCVYTAQTKILPPLVASFKGEVRVDASLKQSPPQTVAVLPFVNRTEHKEAFDVVRKSFHGHFSKLNYTTMPLFKVDDLLRQGGLDTPEKIAEASDKKLREILKVDAVIQGQVTHYDRTYVGLYSQVAVGAEVRMIGGRGDKELWWSKDVSRKHSGGISTGPVGLIMVAISTAMNMRQIELLRSSDDLFREMIKTIPQPTLGQALRPPNITILVHDGMRRTDKYASKVGDVIKVALEGDPRMRASFRIGDFKKEIPMKEEEPGTYAGSYKVMPGDKVEEALIVGALLNDAGNAIEWVDVLGPVTIDTIPPAPPQGLLAVGRDKVADLQWSRSTDKEISRYKVFRSETPLTGYQEAGGTELTAFQDTALANERSYFYKVAAVDLAGNLSKLSEMAKATPVTPGPTLVRGTVAGEVTWFAGASPYILEGGVFVDPKATLTIEPGTVIRSQGEGITVSGRLIARGEPRSPITLVADAPERKWQGIIFSTTKNDESVLEFVKISGAVVGVTCLSSSPVIARSDLSNNQVGLRISEPFAKPRVANNTISGNTVAGVEITSGAAPVLEENEIRGNQKDGIFSRESSPSLTRNQILNNGESGVRLIASAARLSRNNIHDNGAYEVYNSLEKDIPVVAQENWWGSKEGGKIVGKIFGRVEYERVLDGPQPQGQPIDLPILKSALAGSVERDSFLILANSPYVVEKDLLVDQGATLFIQPGVIVRYNPGAAIVVRKGGIDARGTPDRGITFTAGSSAPSPGSYPAAVRFEQLSPVASFFRYCIIEYAETGLDIAYGAPDIDHCLLAQHSQAGIRVANDGAPKISFSTFSQNAGTGAVVALGAARPKISRSNFLGNSFAIQSQSSIYLDARENWWGSAPPPDGLFLGEVNFKPWLNGPEAEAYAGRKP